MSSMNVNITVSKKECGKLLLSNEYKSCIKCFNSDEFDQYKNCLFDSENKCTYAMERLVRACKKGMNDRTIEN